MGFSNSLKYLGTGEYQKAFSSLFISDADIVAGRDVDKRIDAFNQSALERGRIGPEQFNIYQAQLNSSSMESMLEGPESPAGGFVEGAKEGFDAEVKAVQEIKTKAEQLALAAIPWKVVAVVVVGVLLFVIVKKTK